MPPKKSFETALERLEKITEELESGDISLENSLKKFDEGIKLATYCSKELNTAKAKVEILLQKEDGIEAVPFSSVHDGDDGEY